MPFGSASSFEASLFAPTPSLGAWESVCLQQSLVMKFMVPNIKHHLQPQQSNCSVGLEQRWLKFYGVVIGWARVST